MAFFAAGPGYSPSELGALWGKEPKTAGLDYIVTNFMRSDTPTGIGTAAWSAPQQMWLGLLDAIRRGVVVVSDPQAWEMLAEKVPGTTPQSVGGAALTGAQPGAGGGGTSGTDQALQDYYATLTANAQAMQAAQLAYQDWSMRTGDDRLAFEKANEAYRQTFEQAQFAYKQKQDLWNLQQSAGFYEVDGQRTPTLAGIAQQAGLTGYYNGAPTFAREQHQDSTMMGLLGLQANLRGPENYGQYLKVLGSTPQGMRDVVNAAAGRYTLPGTSGVTPGAQPTPVSLQSLLRDVTSGGYGAQAGGAPGWAPPPQGWGTAGAPGAGGGTEYAGGTPGFYPPPPERTADGANYAGGTPGFYPPPPERTADGANYAGGTPGFYPPPPERTADGMNYAGGTPGFYPAPDPSQKRRPRTGRTTPGAPRASARRPRSARWLAVLGAPPAAGGGGAAPAGGIQGEWAQALSGGLPNPNQFNLKNYTRMSPTQRAMLLSAYESQGWEKADVQHMIQQSSPLGAVGTGGQTGTYRF